MLLDAGRIHVMGHWVDRLVTGDQQETMLTAIQYAVFMVVCFPLNVEIVECTYTYCACTIPILVGMIDEERGTEI